LKPRICVDFDDTIFDGKGLLPGCVEVLTKLRESYTIAIFSARSTYAEIRQMREFLYANNVPHDEILPPKPEAVAYIDDKGIRFEGWDMVSL
jgi:hypothetical protein